MSTEFKLAQVFINRSVVSWPLSLKLLSWTKYASSSASTSVLFNKIGKKIDDYYVTKALQLYLEGLSYREIERIIGVSHVTISNWVKTFNIKKPSHADYHPTYKIFNHLELVEYLKNKELLSGAGMIITELGDKFMLIKWERFKD